MKYAYSIFFMILFGLVGIIIIVLFQSITINNESEYYVLKEAMEAAMLESVDVSCYRNDTLDGCGEVVKISEQKFVENFTRRFVASISGDATQYEIEFYDIIESPAKVSVVIRGKTQSYNIVSQDGTDSFDIVNFLDGILIYDKVSTQSDVSADANAVLSPEDPEFNTEDASRGSEDVVDGVPVGIPAS